ncbi:hypothetical protein [Paraclostridium dentum]|uniref:hypothetical protein n=1 Tax=Paraclostridium dentum TaxID=2662455 RepID=UPI003F301BB3
MNTNYLIYTKQDNQYSKSVNVKTLSDNEDFVLGFKNYVKFNSKLLSLNISEYDDILNSLKNNINIVYSLEKINTDKSKELIYMATKYKNEFTSAINQHKIDVMPIKNLSNIFGNTFKFNGSAVKANVFLNKNNREYFEYSEQYPIEMTYIGKSNKTYSAIGINNEFEKSPKYTFFNYSDNDKAKIQQLYGHANILSKIDLNQYISRNRYPEEVLKCIAVADNKTIDTKLLNAPFAYIDNNNNLLLNVNNVDMLGARDKEYYITIASLNESLDAAPFRKIKISDIDEDILISKYLTAINDDNTYCIWIENEYFNIISEIGFVSKSNDINDFNSDLINEKCEKILSQIDFNNELNNIDILSVVMSKTMPFKDMYYDISQTLLDLKLDNPIYIINQLFKNKFENIYINQDKFRKVIYSPETNQLLFENKNNAQIIHIGFKSGVGYSKQYTDNDSIILNKDNDIDVYYLVDINPMIKSGYVMIDNKNNIVTHSIKLEEEK